MKVALVYFRENYTPAPPMGILYIGTVLKEAGFEVRVIDSFPGFNEKNIEQICEFSPDLIGVSVLTTGYHLASKYTRILRQCLADSYICWGGVHTTAMPKQILQDESVDFVVVGEGEQTILEVCNRLSASADLNLEGIKGIMFRHNDSIIDNGKREFVEDLDNLPIPNRELLRDPPYSWYMSPPGIIRGYFLEGITTFYTSRGCPYNCIFCCSHETAGRKLRQRSVGNVLKEIRYLKDKFHIKGLYFNDDTFALDKKWLRDFCSTLKQENLNLVWACQTRANLIGKDTLQEMKSVGCIQVDIGCESGSDKVLRNLKKGIEVRDIIQFFHDAKEVGIKTFATFIIGNPGETLEDIHQTERVALQINSRVNFLILVPYPGSELFEMAKQNGWLLDKQLHFSEKWTNKQSESPVMEINIKSEELLRIRARLQNSYFWRNNLAIFASLPIHPGYLLKIFYASLRHFKEILKAFLGSVKEKKSAVFLEAVYQKFNEELMKI